MLRMPFQSRTERPIKGLVRQMLCVQRSYLVWNRHFDVPRLRAYDCLKDAVIHDVQEMWHLYHTDLPKKLEFAAPFLVPAQQYWKDQSYLRPAVYNATDAAITVEGYEVLWGNGLAGGTVLSKLALLVDKNDNDIPQEAT